MLIHVGCEMEFEFRAPTPLIVMLHLHPTRWPSIREPERMITRPAYPVTMFFDEYGNRCGRVYAPSGRFLVGNQAVVEDSGQPDVQAHSASQLAVQDLPNEVLPFLLASRYCEVDSELKDLSWALFGRVAPGWQRVQAICDYVHSHIRFDYMRARSNRTALETYHERTGVCRDYMHLAITLCRAINIPARYCTGYLGDIGVPPAPPGDFSAWFEAYLGGQWYSFDARNNVPRIGRTLMARGRDAADVAMTTIFGASQLRLFRVWTDELAEVISLPAFAAPRERSGGAAA